MSFGYEGLYQVSNLGRIKSLNYNNQGYEQVLKIDVNKRNGYCHIRLYKEKSCSRFRIHRLVAQAFIPNPDNLPQVNHKNEIKTDNRVENLEWCTSKYNVNYGNRVNKFRLSKKKPIWQLDLQNNIIKKWASSLDAQNELGTKRSHISQCCNNKRKTAGGYKWRWCL